MKTLIKKILRLLILFSIIFSTSPILAQLTSEKISELEKQTNFKIIRFSVYGINTPADAMNLKSLLEAKNGILSCETDLKNNECTIFADFVIQKKDIVALTGPAGIKTSNFSEEIYFKRTQKADNAHITEKESETKKIRSNIELPPDFPKYIDTGNPELDQYNYKIAKEQWISNNYERYKELLNSGKNEITDIKEEEFLTMPEQKKQHILDNPDKYKIVK